MSVGFNVLKSFEDGGGSFNNFGGGFGFGITEKVNFRFRYSRFFSGNVEGGVNLISFTLKFALKQHKVSATLPVSVLFAEGGSIWAISPGFQFSNPNSTNTSEFTFGVRGDLPISDDVDGALISASLGGGFSKDLDRWAFRPEFGILFATSGGEPVFTFALGVNFRLDKSSK